MTNQDVEQASAQMFMSTFLDPGYGDFPHLTEIHHPHLLDPWENRSYPHIGRDYNDPLHHRTETLCVAERPVFKDKAVAYYSM